MTTATGMPGERGQAFGVLAVCFFLSGATGLVYQVVWLRILGLIVGRAALQFQGRTPRIR